MAFLRELLLQFGEPVLPPRGGHHASAFAREQDGRLAADSTGGAHYEHRLSFKETGIPRAYCSSRVTPRHARAKFRKLADVLGRARVIRRECRDARA